MKCKNLLMVTTLGILVTMLVACGNEENKETTTAGKKTEVEYSITVADRDTTTEEKTTIDKTTSESATVVVDNETTVEELTTKVEESSKQDTTTQKPTTQKETTKKKQETVIQKPTTTQQQTTTKKPTTTQQQTTTKEQETTTEVWNKTVYEKAAIELINLINNGGNSEGFNGFYEDTTRVVFEDLILDGVPELLLVGYQGDGNLYVYSNGKYVWYDEMEGYAVDGCKLYKNSDGEIVILEKRDTLGYTEDGENYYIQERVWLFDVTKKIREGLVATVVDDYGNVVKYQQWVQRPNHIGAYDVTKEEYDSLYSEGLKGLTFYKDTYGTAVDSFLETVDDVVRSAYKIYKSAK